MFSLSVVIPDEQKSHIPVGVAGATTIGVVVGIAVAGRAIGGCVEVVGANIEESLSISSIHAPLG
jgi:hypothetical protein